jgi:hypothetical protein
MSSPAHQIADRRLVRYRAALESMPASGGCGAHAALLSVANLGHNAGLTAEQVAKDLAANVHGSRKIGAREIGDAVAKAFQSNAPTVTPPLPVIDGAAALAGILKRGEFADEACLWELSPIRIDWEPEEDAIELLTRLYLPEERIFIGSRFDSSAEHVLTTHQWIARLKQGEAAYEHIAPNPLSGEIGLTKDGKTSYRADNCVAKFKFAVVEFDTLPREKQIQFWAGVLMPVVALLDSGGKSIHGWVPINAQNALEWEDRVEHKLFGILTALGADPACRNESRLSRMPGHFRQEKHYWQRILYLNPSGDKAVMP